MHITPAKARGVGLFEVLVSLLVIALLAALTAPGLSRMVDRNRHQAHLSMLYADLQQARAMALSSGHVVRLRLFSHPGGSCYVLHHGAAGSCTCDGEGQTQCMSDAALIKSHWLPQSTRLRLAGSVTQLAFHPKYGTVSRAGTLSIHGPAGSRADHVVAITGRVRSCATAAAQLRLPVCAG